MIKAKISYENDISSLQDTQKHNYGRNVFLSVNYLCTYVYVYVYYYYYCYYYCYTQRLQFKHYDQN